MAGSCLFGYFRKYRVVTIVCASTLSATGSHGCSVTYKSMICSTAWVGRKPSTMQYSVYMAECGASLMQELEYPTDATLLALVQLQHMAEENHGTLCMASNRVHDQMSTQRIKTHMSSFQVQLQCWESSLAPVPRHSGMYKRNARSS